MMRVDSTQRATAIYEREYTSSIQKLARIEPESSATKKLKSHHRSGSRQLKRDKIDVK